MSCTKGKKKNAANRLTGTGSRCRIVDAINTHHPSQAPLFRSQAITKALGMKIETRFKSRAILRFVANGCIGTTAFKMMLPSPLSNDCRPIDSVFVCVIPSQHCERAVVQLTKRNYHTFFADTSDKGDLFNVIYCALSLLRAPFAPYTVPSGNQRLIFKKQLITSGCAMKQ